MRKINEKLYDYILENKESLTNEWLSTRSKADGTTYSKNSTPDVERQLREENGAFIEAITNVFIEEKEQCIEQWAIRVAEERAKKDVPMHEIIAQFRVFRSIYWRFVRKFIEEAGEEVTVHDVLRWSESLNSTFDYIIEAFTENHQKIMQKLLACQQEMITELSSPVIPIKKGIGVLPVVGDIDTYRAKVILESSLEQCLEKGVQTLFIDLSAVPIVDTMVAHQLFQLLSSLKLIGVASVLSGIRPEVAQTATQLGIDFSDVTIQSTLLRALEEYEK
ncbi:STAS domain-containing protein [Bacillus aerolatus]|uniref:STAS domain-containing protein n=1 Tax=Bacillus aerolatus TaxID=2653354 RepID=A0A6I1FDH4_9BACI|nr:STAS domain-containing protein [Bacillus aerolatus]KAB7705530.1 STAS domain-containing protein [Bacillus aerolatus]